MHLRFVTVNTEFGNDIVLVQLKPSPHKDLTEISSQCSENENMRKNASEHFANIENLHRACYNFTGSDLNIYIDRSR